MTTPPRLSLRLALSLAALALAACAGDPDDDSAGASAEEGQAEAGGEGDVEPLSLPKDSMLLGMHSPPWNDLGSMNAVFGGARGWLFDVVYATDYDWAPGIGGGASAAARAGYNVMLRIDYARPDGTGFADASPTLGATIPPSGDVGHCLIRRGTDAQGNVVDKGPSREVGGEHLDCYLAYIDDIVRAAPDVHAWTIGNEMNMKLEAKGFPGGAIDPAWYASVYKAASARIHALAGHEGDAVFLGGVAPGPASDLKYMSGDDFLKGMLAALKPAEVGGVALHAYGGWPQVEHNGGKPAKDLFAETYRAQLKVIDAAGFPCAPAIVTEFSVHTHIGDPNIHDEPFTAQFIADAVQGIHAWNSSPDNHALLGAVWFIWDSGGFSEESLRPFFAVRQVAGQNPDNNPALRFAAVAPQFPAGPSGTPAKCKEPPQPAPPQPQAGACPCLDTLDGKPVDNVCFYAAQYKDCQTLLGAAQCSDDAQWALGWHLHNNPQQAGYVCGAGEPPPPQGTCACVGGVDNFCSYGPGYAGCSMTAPGGYCDPNSDGSFSDGDWGRGFSEYAAQCG